MRPTWRLVVLFVLVTSACERCEALDTVFPRECEGRPHELLRQDESHTSYRPPVLNSASLDDVIKGRFRHEKFLVYYFYPSCPFCQQFDPLYSRVCRVCSLLDIPCFSVNIEQERIGEKRGIHGVPTVIYYGADVHRFTQKELQADAFGRSLETRLHLEPGQISRELEDYIPEKALKSSPTEDPIIWISLVCTVLAGIARVRNIGVERPQQQ